MENKTKNAKPSKSIVQMSKAAIAKIHDMMEKEGKDGCALRVDVTTGGCAGLSYSLRFQKEPYDNDIIFTQGDLKLFINPESVPFLTGIEIDYIDTLNMSGFQYKNPNASSTCGCGVSFS